MLKHLLLTALRSLRKNKLFTTINVLGLSVSIAVFLALISYVKYHLGFDKFYPDGDRIYRIEYKEFREGQTVLQTAKSHSRTALVATSYVPEIEALTRAYHEKAYVWNENIKLVDQHMMFVDSTFCKVFKLKMISGSCDEGLTPPKAVLISRSQAKVYFGDDDPMGKTIFFNERLPFTVTGVFEDLPSSSSIDFDFLLSFSTIIFYGWGDRDGDFARTSVYTFAKLREGEHDIKSINERLTRMATENMRDLAMRGNTASYELRSYEDLHTATNLTSEIKPGVNKTLLYALLSLAVFILVTAWINYVNLSVARSIDRASEIGVRKVFGATRWIISGQFLVESALVAIFTFGVGFMLYRFVILRLFGIGSINSDLLSADLQGWPILFVGFVAITALVSFYPAHFISRFKPALILKNKIGTGRGKINILHDSLIIFQLFLAVTVLSVALIAGRQISFMLDFDAGFNATQTITLRAPASTNSDSLRYPRYTSFRSEVLQHSAFKSGSASFEVPGAEIRFHDEGVHAIGRDNDKKQSFQVLWVDDGFQETFDMKLLGGRNFNQVEKGYYCVVNESAVAALGYTSREDALNTRVRLSNGGIYTIAGIWKDYHHESMHKPVSPVIFLHKHPYEYGYYSFKVETSQRDFVQDLKAIWDKHYPNDQFIYYFMDSFFGQQYQSDMLFGRLLNLFSVIALIVAALGLFGVASLAMVKQTKEIGIRKVLGASVVSILSLLSRRYVIMIAIGCVIAFPLSWYLTNQWLSDFSYRIDIQWWMIIVPGIIVLVGTLLTISVLSVRAALVNPVRSLKE
jgi:putative ABC transport system permease protein